MHKPNKDINIKNFYAIIQNVGNIPLWCSATVLTKYRKEMGEKQMADSWTTKNGYKIIKILSGRSNVFLVSKDKKAFLVDTSVKRNANKLCAEIDSIGESVLPSYLVLTHAHGDHVENAYQIKEKYRTQVIAQENHIQHLTEGACPIPKGTLFFNKWVDHLMSKGLKSMCFEALDTDITVYESYNFKEFEHVSIVHTPGHTSGSICVLVDDEIGIVGDAMFGIFKNSIYPPWADSIQEMVKSWGKLLDTECHTFLPSHGWQVSRALLQKQYEKYKKKLKI